MAYGNIVGQTSEGFSKDEILTGATANKFDLSDAAVPNDVFDFLGKFNQHWWRRRTEQKAIDGYSLTVDGTNFYNNFNFIGFHENPSFTYSIQYSESVRANSDGVVSLVNPKTVSGSYNDPSPFEVLSGKYFLPYQQRSSETVKIQYAEPNQKPVKRSVTFNNYYYLYFSKIKTEFHSTTKFGGWEYVTSSDRSAYPDNGEKDGYTYQYLGIPYDNIKSVPRISIGYYDGTGKYGKDYPNRITFDFKPTLLAIHSLGLYSNIENAFQYGSPVVFQFWFMPHTWNRQSFEMPIGGSSGSPNKAKWVDDTTLEWYSEEGALEQFNYGYGYFYIAIG